MKVLQTSQKYIAILGISPEQSKQTIYSNHKILMGFILLGYSLVGHLMYLINEVSTFGQCVECICATFAPIVITTCFASMVFRMSILFESIDNIESLIETSE